MIEYPALIDGVDGAYGVVFPDIPGVGAMGDTVDEALANAEEALKDYAIETETDGEELAVPSLSQSVEAPVGNRLVFIPLARTQAKALVSD